MIVSAGIGDFVYRLTHADSSDTRTSATQSNASHSSRISSASDESFGHEFHADRPPANQSLDMSPSPRGAQVTKQGTIIETVAGFPITRDEKGVYVHADCPDDAVLAMLHHSIERYGTKLRIRAPEDFQLRVGKLAGLNHLDVWFENPEVEQARQAGRAAAPVPISGAAQSYIHERNSKRNRISDIPFHRLWRSSDAGLLAFNGLRVVDHQTLLLLSNGTEMIVLPISPQQRRELASIQRGTQLNIGSQLLIQTPVQGLER
jgi:hypothetical protein